MPSSLIFTALAVAWLVVLVPMFARRRHEIARTADPALAARVVRRGSPRRAGEVRALSADDDHDHFYHHGPYDDHLDHEDDHYDEDFGDEPPRYRPGRGGFDPDAAALAARAKYAARQRIVLLLLLAALATGLLAGFAMAKFWWVHGGFDVLLVVYLTYLRRQGRIEEEIRQRRMARLSGTRRRDRARERVHVDLEDVAVDDEPEPAPEPVVEARPTRQPHQPARPGAVVVEIDDEDPVFDELDEPGEPRYRRAVGE